MVPWFRVDSAKLHLPANKGCRLRLFALFIFHHDSMPMRRIFLPGRCGTLAGNLGAWNLRFLPRLCLLARDRLSPRSALTHKPTLGFQLRCETSPTGGYPLKSYAAEF